MSSIPVPSEAILKRRRWWVSALTALSLIAAGGAVGWATSAVFAPPPEALTESRFTLVDLVDGEVGSAMTLNAVAEWTQTLAGTNQAAGVVTAVLVSAGHEVSAGDLLYEVNLRPIVVAAGATPSFRMMSRGDTGADVAQLQRLLVDLGFFSGVVDGEFEWETEAAVEEWQRSLGVEDDGVIQPGDLLFVPELPTRVVLDNEVVSRGAVLAGGEAVVSTLSTEPIFRIEATSSQANMMPAGTRVELRSGDTEWVSYVSGQERSLENPDQIQVSLQGGENATICGDTCSAIPMTGESLLTARVVTQETTAGIIAPAAALLSSPDGDVSVVDEDGRLYRVQVVASARGMSVVEGAPAGLRVRVPAFAEESGK